MQDVERKTSVVSKGPPKNIYSCDWKSDDSSFDVFPVGEKYFDAETSISFHVIMLLLQSCESFEIQPLYFIYTGYIQFFQLPDSIELNRKQ